VTRLSQWIRSGFAPGEISLGHYLAVAFLLRLPAIVFSRGYDFLDHQFQYIDPAYHIAFDGSWHQYHDYVQGLRSWVYPGILAGIFRAVAWMGITEPRAMMAATRFVHGAVSLVPLAALWVLIVRWLGWRNQRPLLLFVAANALVVYSGVQPTGPTFAVGLALTAFFLFHGPGRIWPFVSGILLGLSFACRFQDAFYGPVLLAAGLLQKRWGASLAFVVGASITVTLQGLVDLWTWGSFLHSPFRYVSWNIFEGAATSYGQQPVWYYAAFLCGVLILVPPFLKSGLEALAEGGRRLPVLAVAAVSYVVLHNLVTRKSFRFIIASVILLLIVYASALIFRKVEESKLRSVHRTVFVTAHVLALVAASFWYPHRGPVEAALTLGAQKDFQERLVVVGGTHDDVGGHYYLRRKRLEVIPVERVGLARWLRRERPQTPLYLMVVRRPLDTRAIPDGYQIDPLGVYNDWPDVKENTRRFLYRLTTQE
jgi:hypothetical protein